MQAHLTYWHYAIDCTLLSFESKFRYAYILKEEDDDSTDHGSENWHSFQDHWRGREQKLSLLHGTYSAPQLYGSRTVVIPKMPSLGLLLEHPVFDSYNIRVREKNKGLKESDADFRPELDFTPYNDQIHQFKDEQIYSRMRASEDRVAVWVVPFLHITWIKTFSFAASIDGFGQ